MGSGYKTFTAGAVLTASDVQNYLQDQSVMVFADSTARASSIGTANFEEGMVSYLEDTDAVEVYDGSAWGNIAPATNQGLTLINTTSFSGVSSQSFNNVFTSTYENYKVLFSLDIATGTPNLTFRFRAAGSDITTAGYFLFGDRTGGAVSNIASTSQTSMLLGVASTATNNGILEIFKPQLTATKAVQANYYYANNGENYDLFCGTNYTTSCDGFSLIVSSSTMTGTASVFGYNK